MKKFILVAVALVATVSANAQTTEEKGKNSIEIGFNPFTQNKNTFSIDEIKYRRFWGANALRVTGKLSMSTTANKTTEEETDRTATAYGNEWTKTKVRNTEFCIGLGYERHFEVAKRVGLFAGAEIGYEADLYKSQIKSESEWTVSATNITTNADLNYKVNYFPQSMIDPTADDVFSKHGFYAALVGGIDVNVYKGLYLGAEIGLRIGHASSINDWTIGKANSKTSDGHSSSTKLEKDKKTVTTDGVSVTTDITYTTTDTDRFTDFGLYAEPALRIGYRF